MKAMVIEAFGGPDVFTQAEIPDPELKPGHLVIKVQGSSVNPIDLKIRSGAVAAAAPPFPAVLHGDVAGTVACVGEAVTGFSPGDEVYACICGPNGPSEALAEFAAVDARLVASKPRHLEPIKAAVLPLVGITAWEALVDRAQIREGQRILIHAACGGVGHVAIQIAKALGVTVFATVSNDEKASLAHKLGADGVINYREQRVDQYVRECTDGEGFDVVFDTVGGECLANSFVAARKGGTVVTIAARSTQDLTPCHGKGLTLHMEFMLLGMLNPRLRAHQGEILAKIAGLVDLDRMCPLIDDEVFGFTEVSAAHARLESGKAIGKIRMKADF